MPKGVLEKAKSQTSLGTMRSKKPDFVSNYELLMFEKR